MSGRALTDGARANRVARLGDTLARRLSGAAEPLLAQVARRLLFGALRRLRVGCLTVILPDGARHVFGDRAADLRGTIVVHDPEAAVRLLLRGATGAGEGYMDGLWSSPDLPALLELGARNQTGLALSGGWWQRPFRWPLVLAHRARRNTIDRARRNITAHYDLGNEFYRLWLDPSLTYSSAVFTAEDQPLADAQREKYRVNAERAGLRSGQHVLEIGTGWGGFALYAAGELGCRVTSITISEAQAALARERVGEAGLGDLVEIRLQDYRELTGTYDAIVSIEMLEAVGHEYYPTFFAVCDRVLSDGGRMSLQTITIPDADYEAQRRSANWIQSYIFPGGLLPSLAVIEHAIRNTHLLITATTDIAPSYVRTLHAWRTRFLEQVEAVRALGFDERFLRMWEYYLALSEAVFKTGVAQDHQLVFEKRRGLG